MNVKGNHTGCEPSLFHMVKKGDDEGKGYMDPLKKSQHGLPLSLGSIFPDCTAGSAELLLLPCIPALCDQQRKGRTATSSLLPQGKTAF